MHVRTLGISQITVGDDAIGTERPTVFTLLFMLAMEHPRPISRASLGSRMWPIAIPAERHHRLRTLLYRARRMGAPIVRDASGAVALSRRPTVDFREFATRPWSIEDARARLPAIGPILPGLDALSCAGLAEIFDDARDVIVATMIQWLRLALLLARKGGDWPLVEQLARTARDIDAHDHAAWRTLVEAECITIGRGHALRTLDEYLALVASDDANHRSALAMQRRIVAEGASCAEVPRLVGRDAAMRRIWSALARAESGQGGALLLWGPAGVGKTRLLDEIERVSLAARSRVVRVTTSPVHALQPLGLVRNLAKRLLDEPGAAGCEPEAFRLLRAFTAPNASAEAVHGESVEGLFAALAELLAALTDEASLIICIDDLHVVGAEAWPLWRAAVHWSAIRRLLWVFAFRALSDAELSGLPDPTLLRRLRVTALDRPAAMEILGALDPGASRVRHEHMLNVSSGYPLLLQAAGQPFDSALAARAQAAVENTITRLGQGSSAVLGAIALSAGGASGEQLANQIGVDPRQLSAMITELERAGMIYSSDGGLNAYGIWAEAVLEGADAPHAAF